MEKADTGERVEVQMKVQKKEDKAWAKGEGK